ncbi:MAG: hypothetical protein IH899_14425 [Planctomycetes bacterium]|nr:hypothetical protein [Planctomycetota bacterium]
MEANKNGPVAIRTTNVGREPSHDDQSKANGNGQGGHKLEAGLGQGAGSEGANITPHHGSVLEEAKEVFKRWLELPNDDILDFVFGVVFANRFGGDPVWGGIVGASGDTKTEILRCLIGDQFVQLSGLTAKTLISGLPKEMCGGIEPSLLPRLNGKILVIKDLTPLISGHADTRATVLGQLRDAYDGSSAMAFGTGERKEFKSRFGMLFGVTPVIESCWPIINALGERFIYYRCPGGDSLQKVRAALANSSRKKEMRKELQDAARRVLEQNTAVSIDVPDGIMERIAHLADFVAIARTPVKRHGQTEEVSYEPSPEVGTRLGGQLIQLACGIAAARGQQAPDDSIMNLVLHVARSGIMRKRVSVLAHLTLQNKPAGTSDVGQAIRQGSDSTRRTLEDLWTLKLVDRAKVANAHSWQLSELARERLGIVRLFPTQNDDPQPTPP